jgi:hypothetical protein
MNKRALRSASIVIAIALALGVFTPGQATSQNAALMANETVNLAFFYKPPSNSDAVTVANNFNSVKKTSSAIFQKKWAYGGTLTTGLHKLKLLFVGPSSARASLDAVSIS